MCVPATFWARHYFISTPSSEWHGTSVTQPICGRICGRRLQKFEARQTQGHTISTNGTGSSQLLGFHCQSLRQPRFVFFFLFCRGLINITRMPYSCYPSYPFGTYWVSHIISNTVVRWAVYSCANSLSLRFLCHL